MEKIRLIVADDHAILRAGLRSVLESIPECEVVAEAADGVEALELVRKFTPHFLLTDISMPKMDGLALTERVTRHFPDVRVMIVSIHDSHEFVERAVQCGAVGYLLKDADAADFRRAINQVYQGGPGFFMAFTKVDALNAGGNSHVASDRLTVRQREILRFIADGMSTKGIANLLEISAKTVEAHRVQIKRRLAISDVAGLVRHAVRTGLISLEN